MPTALLSTEAKKPDGKKGAKKPNIFAPKPVNADSTNAFFRRTGMSETKFLDAVSKTYGDLEMTKRRTPDKKLLKSQKVAYLEAKTVAEFIRLLRQGKYKEEKARFIDGLRGFENFKHVKIPLGDDFAKLDQKEKDYYNSQVMSSISNAFGP